MPLDWMDVRSLSFNSLLLLERVQISWLPRNTPEDALGTALHANPVVGWYLRNKCPEIAPWLDRVLENSSPPTSAEAARQAEETILRQINDWIVYVVDPAAYDAQPFLVWDNDELTGLVDFTGKTVIDVGSGTGRLGLVAASHGAAAVFAVEPVGNLRRYLKEKSRRMGLKNIYPVDGLIIEIPFPAEFADIVMGEHVLGEGFEAENQELWRVTKHSGMILLCPGNSDKDNNAHHFLIEHGFEWSRFEESRDGWKRKYWKTAIPNLKLDS